jgi:hypothetical protein
MKLRGLLLAISGRYVDRANGRGYVRTELFTALPEAVLQRDVELKKQGPGIYTVTVRGREPLVYDLYSRRRRPRTSSD